MTIWVSQFKVKTVLIQVRTSQANSVGPTALIIYQWLSRAQLPIPSSQFSTAHSKSKLRVQSTATTRAPELGRHKRHAVQNEHEALPRRRLKSWQGLVRCGQFMQLSRNLRVSLGVRVLW